MIFTTCLNSLELRRSVFTVEPNAFLESDETTVVWRLESTAAVPTLHQLRMKISDVCLWLFLDASIRANATNQTLKNWLTSHVRKKSYGLHEKMSRLDKGDGCFCRKNSNANWKVNTTMVLSVRLRNTRLQCIFKKLLKRSLISSFPFHIQAKKATRSLVINIPITIAWFLCRT